MSKGGDFPSVAAGLGQPLDRIRSASTYQLDFSHLQDSDLIVIGGPISFRYLGDGAFSIPPTRFLGLTTMAAIVTGVEIAPQLEYESSDAVLELANALRQEALHAGWSDADDQQGVTGPRELNILLRTPAAADQRVWHLAKFSRGAQTLLFRLRRIEDPHSGAERELYLLNLVWRDKELDDRLYQIAKSLRQDDKLPPERARSIRMDSYLPRVVEHLQTHH